MKQTGMMLGMMLGLMLAAGAWAAAGTLEGTAQWAGTAGRANVAGLLTRRGITNATEAAAIMDDWNEAQVVDSALEHRAYGFLAWVGRRDRFGDESVRKIRRALLAEPRPTPEVIDLVDCLPVGERAAFEPLLYSLVAQRHPETPVFGRHRVKYATLGNAALFCALTDPRDMLEVLLAPEPLGLAHAEAARRAIRDAAVRRARANLRAQGSSFVVRDGINPLAEALRPVIEALNAPGCAGLEAALRGLGVEVDDFDRERGDLEALAAGWQAEIISGERAGTALNAVLGKLSVVLGVEGFNAFVERYNHGTGGGDDAR